MQINTLAKYRQIALDVVPNSLPIPEYSGTIHHIGELWCICCPPSKIMTNRRVQSAETFSEQTVRATISFPELQYMELERIAHEQRVSLAWVVRDAVQEYLNTRWPLLEVESERQKIETKKQ